MVEQAGIYGGEQRAQVGALDVSRLWIQFNYEGQVPKVDVAFEWEPGREFIEGFKEKKGLVVIRS